MQRIKNVVIKNRRAFTFALAMSLLAAAVAAGSAGAAFTSDDPVVVYFFWGDGCPHCEHAKPFLADLAGRYPQVVIRDYEVWHAPENADLLRAMAARLDFEPRAVPTLIIGNRHWVGFSDQLGREMESYVVSCVESGACPDAGAGIVPGVDLPPAGPQEPQAKEAPAESPRVLALPLLGEVDLSAQSLLLSTALIAFVDGFNPCSMWVLSILIALTLHTGSRRKVLIIGLVFITVTAGVYMLFIAGLFTVLSVVSFLGWIQVVVAGLALAFAVVNIKDYFWYKEGVSFTIADDKKPGIYQRARNILNASESFWAMVGATVVMAAGVSLVEFSCTAGFPVLWTNLLSAQGVTPATFALLLAVYMVIYQIDELGLFLIAVFTLKTGKLEEKHGRILKLVGGMLMLTLAVVMIVDPNLMNELRNSLLIFGGAFVATALVLVIHRWVLPRFGVTVGTESAKSGTRLRRKPLSGTRQ
jgi:thiol-disulfide isomerase/thioredoxin